MISNFAECREYAGLDKKNGLILNDAQLMMNKLSDFFPCYGYADCKNGKIKSLTVTIGSEKTSMMVSASYHWGKWVVYADDKFIRKAVFKTWDKAARYMRFFLEMAEKASFAEDKFTCCMLNK